jgi:hypothetical protein
VTSKAKRGRGRPIAEAAKGKRATMSFLVRPDLKRVIAQRAAISGRTLSAEGEAMLEGYLVFERTLTAMRTSLADMQQDTIAATLVRLGYTPVRSAQQKQDGTPWKLWAEPGFPGIERSGFVP